MSWLSLYVGPLLVIIKHKNSVSDVHLAVCLYSLFGFGIWFQQTFHWLNKSHHKNIAFTITFFPPNRKKHCCGFHFHLEELQGEREVIPICLWNRNRGYGIYLPHSPDVCRCVLSPPIKSTPYLRLTVWWHHIHCHFHPHISHVDLRKNRNWH